MAPILPLLSPSYRTGSALVGHHAGVDNRDRDSGGRPQNARPRDAMGRPLPYGSPGVERVPDSVGLDPDEALRQGQRLIDDGFPFQAHEIFEGVWKATAGTHRELWRGLAQLAVGLTHLQRGNHSGGFAETVAELADYEKAGLDIVFVPEAYSFDAVSQLGFIAARTERLHIASGILQIYTRTPALTAMTAAGLDYVSGGRFTLGIGASGPQVIEGFHGVPYTAPLGRTRELVEICRRVWRRERLEYQGRHYQ